jgi:hypothetical protein
MDCQHEEYYWYIDDGWFCEYCGEKIQVDDQKAKISNIIETMKEENEIGNDEIDYEEKTKQMLQLGNIDEKKIIDLLLMDEYEFDLEIKKRTHS